MGIGKLCIVVFEKRIIIIGIPRDPLLFFLRLLSNTKQSKAKQKGIPCPKGYQVFVLFPEAEGY